MALSLAVPAGAQTIERIKETGELRLGFRTDAVPLSYQTDEGNPAGYTPELCAVLAQGIINHLQISTLDVNFVPVDTRTRFDAVANGEIDILCGAATITLGRRQKVDFSVPIYVDGASVMLPVAADESFQSLEGKTIGVRAGTTTEAGLETTLSDLGMTAKIERFNDHGAGVDAVANGTIDAYFADQSILLGQLGTRKLARSVKVSNDILTIEKHGLAMARGDSDFRLLVDTVLSEMFDGGTIETVFRESMPGVVPGIALQAMFLLSPTLP
nr:amino acid ABC transporter substrate-binding protein [Shimia biformata]